MKLYAWIGEDEFGSGVVGLKQAITNAGIIPLVSVQRDKLEQPFIVEQLQRQANVYGKRIRLAEFELLQELRELVPR